MLQRHFVSLVKIIGKAAFRDVEELVDRLIGVLPCQGFGTFYLGTNVNCTTKVRKRSHVTCCAGLLVEHNAAVHRCRSIYWG